MQLPLEGLAASPLPQPSKKPHAKTAFSAADRKRLREYHREWERNNKDRTKAYHIRKYSKVKEKLKAKRAKPEYRAKMRDYLRQYRLQRKEYLRQLNKTWRSKNKKWIKDYNYNRRRTDSTFNLLCSMQSATRRAFAAKQIKKSRHTKELLGCTIEEAKAHIEAQFPPGMSWANRNTWDIDHIVPVSAFNIADAEEAALAFNWRNLQPLTKHKNYVKNDTLPDPLPQWLPLHIASRIRSRAVC